MEDAPDFGVEICRQGATTYTDCIFERFNSRPMNEPEFCTKFKNGDKLNAHLKWGGEKIPLERFDTDHVSGWVVPHGKFPLTLVVM